MSTFDGEDVLRRELQRAEDRIRRLHVLAAELSAATTIEAVGRALIDTGMHALDADMAALWQIDGQIATMVASSALVAREPFHAISMAVPAPITQVVRTGAPIFIEARAEYARLFPAAAAMTSALAVGAQAFACLPLASDGIVRAVVAFAFARVRTFDPGERGFLALIARHASIAFERALDHAARERGLRRLRRLHEATDALAMARTPHEVAEATVRLGTEAIDARGGAIWLAQPDGSLVVESSHDIPASYLAAWLRVPPDSDLPIMRVLRTGRPMWVETPADFVREAPEIAARARAANRLWAFAALPLDGLGAVTFSYGGPHVFSEDERYFLLALGRTCEHALERARLHVAAEVASVNKDEFLAMLGHELRNPLAAMVSALDLLRLREQQLGRELSIFERHLRHLVQLVGGLVDVSRITQGKITLHRTAVDVASAIEFAIDSARHAMDPKRHELVVSVTGNPLVDADRDRIGQVLANLVTNAARYTPQGRIEITAAAEGEHVEIRVRDTGIGITPTLMPHLFDMFVQGERAADRSEGGLGIGLTIVRRLVELHGGTVHAHSDGPGTGATFVVRWPRAGSSTATVKIRALPNPNSRRLRVLIVDRDRDHAELLGELVRSMGHEVAIAYDGETALRTAEQSGPHVALLDVTGGYGLAQRLRAVPALQSAPLIALGRDGDREQARQAGFSHHLAKPVDIAMLAALLPDDE